MKNLQAMLAGAVCFCLAATGCRKDNLETQVSDSLTQTAATTSVAAVAGKKVYNVIKPGGDLWYYTNNFNKEFNVNPGDTVVLKAGTYGHIDITHIDGVTFINEGQVIVDSWNFNNGATNVKLLGNGTPGIKYGIKINGKNNFATRWFATGNLEIAHIEIDGSKMGFQVKTLPYETYPLNWINLSIHDCLIQNTGQEGVYAGADELGGPYMIGKIYNVIVKNTGRDGIQVRNGTFEVYDNVVDGIGTSNDPGHTHGILFGGNTNNGICRNNKVSNVKYGFALFINGYGTFTIECNDFKSSGSSIFTKNFNKSEDLQKVGRQEYIVRNNSMTSDNNQSMETYMENNGIPVKVTYTGNKTSGKAAVQKDIPLTQSNNGPSITLQSCGSITTPTTPTPPVVTVPNVLPVANAGADKTITLPVNSLTLAGSGTDADGQVASYAWTKTAGPTQFTIGSPSSAQTLISNLAQGTYTFQLKVTDNKGASHTDAVNVVVKAAVVTTPTTPVPSTPATPPATAGKVTKVEAEKYASMSGVQIVSGNRVGYIHTGDWMNYNINVAAAGAYTFRFRVAPPGSARKFEVRNASGTVLATINIPKTRWWGDFTTVTSTINLPAGAQTIRLHATSADWDIDWFEFVKN